MATRRKIPRSGETSTSIFADLSPEKRRAMLDELPKQEAAFAAEQAERVRQAAATPAIRNGVKTERDTQPVQVRMLKSQQKVLKQLAEQEDRTSSDIIRDLVDAYIAYCLKHWPKGDKLDILRSTVRATNYAAERHGSADVAIAWATGTKFVGSVYDPSTDDMAEFFGPADMSGDTRTKAGK
ncbi:MAG: hypothetical protein JO067_11075 [Cupriavidus sp.]|nr:hypothetical protein [Cupriavidus sp.]